MKKTKKEKFPYKYLRVEQIDELNRLDDKKIIKELIKHQKDLRAHKKLKKEDKEIQSLKEQIDHHRADISDELKKERDDLKARLKEISQEVDSDIVELLEDKKALNKGYNDVIKQEQEWVEVVTNIINKRNF